MSSITIKVPNWLDIIFAWPVMVWRRYRYGYDYRRIELGEGEWTIVEPRDYYRFGQFRWSIGGRGRNIYACRTVRMGDGKTKMALLHREIMEAPSGLLVDHKNGDTLDNRRVNLRLATHAENTQNRRKTQSKTSSQFIGVYFEKRSGRWAAKIKNQGRCVWLGRFESEAEAAHAYDAAAKKYHGEFARLNFTETADSVERIVGDN
ncbi:MAG: AP2 domain-containing protein [Sedimentisphaerales bacterium]|jgi:hypothetical protein